MRIALLLLVPALMSAQPGLRLISQRESPVLTKRNADAVGNKYGFEGGRVVKLGSTYHLFTSEMAGDPIWVKMKLAYWQSPDGRAWKRIATLFESSGEFEGKDPRASLWSPLPVSDERANRWNLFYVAYRSAPIRNNQFLLNHHGEIWRAVSQTAGRAGIGGPYRDAGIIMRPGADSGAWEGLQGTDSFFPYRIGPKWYALYGSAKSHTIPIQSWLVGMAEAPAIGGPWRRMSALNPAPIEKVFIENPIVEPLPGGGYLCVYDSNVNDAIGYAFSPDGVHWLPGHALVIQPKAGVWARDVRTPLGLVAEGNGEYTVFYTGFEEMPAWTSLLAGKGGSASCAVGMVRVKLASGESTR